MKGTKKLIALVLVVMMALSNVSAVSAKEVKNSTQAKVLYDLGLFNGMSTTQYEPNLEGSTNREQAIVMLGRLLGWDVSNPPSHPFTDVSAWAEPYIAVAYQKGVTAGIGNGLFGSSYPVTQRQVLSWISSEAGYGKAYDNIDYAVDAGLISVGEAVEITFDVYLKTEKELIRDDLVGIFYRAVSINRKNNTTTILEDLVEGGIVDRDKAVASGLISNPVSQKLTVTNAEMTNYKQIMITFNKEPDKALVEDVANYQVKDRTVQAAKLNGKVVTLTLQTPVSAQSNVEVTIKRAAGLEEEVVRTISNVIDYTPPFVTDIQLTGPTTVEVSFSEPLDPTTIPVILINNGAYGATVGTPVDNKVTVTLGGRLTNGSYTITIKNAKDLAGLFVAETQRTLNYSNVQADVTAQVKEARQNEVVIEFSQKLTDALTVSDFYYAYTNYVPNEVKTEDNRIYTLTFNSYMIPEGSWVLTVKKDRIESEWGNKAASDIKLPFTVKIDTSAPTVALDEVKTEDSVVLAFSKPLNKASAENKSNYVLRDNSNKVLDLIDSVTYNETNHKVTVRMKSKLEGGIYTITVKDVQDNTPQSNKVSEVKINVTITDKTPPVAVKADVVVAEKIIYVEFNESMSDSVLNINYWRMGSQKPKSVEFFNTKSKVKLTFENPISLSQSLVVGQVADISNNQIEALQTTIPTNELARVAITSVKATASNRVELVLDGRIIDGLRHDNFIFFSHDGAISRPAAVISYNYNDKGQTVVVAVMNNEISFKADEKPAKVQILGDYLKADTGVKVTTVAFEDVKDGIAPSAVNQTERTYANKNNRRAAVIAFDESLSTQYQGLLTSEVSVRYNNTLLVPGIDYNVVIEDSLKSKDTFVIMLKEGFNSNKYFEADGRVDISVANSKYIQDINGNTVNSFSLILYAK